MAFCKGFITTGTTNTNTNFMFVAMFSFASLNETSTKGMTQNVGRRRE